MSCYDHGICYIKKFHWQKYNVNYYQQLSNSITHYELYPPALEAIAITVTRTTKLFIVTPRIMKALHYLEKTTEVATLTPQATISCACPEQPITSSLKQSWGKSVHTTKIIGTIYIKAITISVQQ